MVFARLAAAVFVAAAAMAAPAAAQDRDSPAQAGRPFVAPEIAPGVSHFRLGNGLEVVVIPDHRAPVATHMIWYKVGAADEPRGLSGIAHFLEHLMFKGTAAHPDGAFSAIVARIGGEENAFTTQDYTAYYQRVAKEHLKLVMGLEADRMTGLELTDGKVAPERQVILEERNSRVDNDPSAQLGEAVDSVLFANGPYGIPVIGWRHEMEALTRQDALAFYKRWYAPNNAVLVVAGDVTAEEVRSLAEETYGRVPANPDVPDRLRPREPEPAAEILVRLADERVREPSLRRAWLVPSYTTATGRDAEAIDLFAEVLGGGATSRLYRELVVEQRLATSVGAWYQSTALGDTKFMVYGVPAESVDLPTLQEAILKSIARLAEEGPTPSELLRAKRKIVASAIYAQDSQSSLARIFGAALTTGGTVAGVRAWPERIAAVTAADVKGVARRYVDGRPGVSGFLEPKGGAKAGPTASSPATGAGQPVH